MDSVEVFTAVMLAPSIDDSVAYEHGRGGTGPCGVDAEAILIPGRVDLARWKLGPLQRRSGELKMSSWKNWIPLRYPLMVEVWRFLRVLRKDMNDEMVRREKFGKVRLKC